VWIFQSLLQTHEKILGENLSEPVLLLAAALSQWPEHSLMAIAINTIDIVYLISISGCVVFCYYRFYSYLKLIVMLRMSYLQLWRIWTSVIRFRISSERTNPEYIRQNSLDNDTVLASHLFLRNKRRTTCGFQITAIVFERIIILCIVNLVSAL
jgi:hypothetical protein